MEDMRPLGIEYEELVRSVLDWWQEHRFDVVPTDDGDEENVYDVDYPPDFVVKALALAERKETREKGEND